MDTALINVRTNLKLKLQAQKVADDLGFSLSSLVKAYLKTLVKTKTVYFSDAEEPSDYLIKAMKEAKEERRKGKFYSFANSGDALKLVDDVVAGKR